MNWGVFCAVIAAFCWFLVFASASILNKEKKAGELEEAEKTRTGGAAFLLLAVIFTSIAAGLLS